MILGVGIDLVETTRFARAGARHGAEFFDRILTPAEIAACAAARRPHEQQAVRFAAREAVLKALGTGLSAGMAWKDIEVVPGDGPGVVSVELRGGVRRAAEALGVCRVHVAVCSTKTVAAASAMLEGEKTEDRSGKRGGHP